MRKSVFDRLLSFVFVDKCALCRKPCEKTLCEQCLKNLKILTTFCCERCGKPLGSCVCKTLKGDFQRCVSAFRLEDRAVSALIYKLKSRGSENVAQLLSFYLAKKVEKEYADINFNFITYVPQTYRETKRKGFDHARLIAGELSNKLSIDIVCPPIKRKRGRKQKFQDYRGRSRNASEKYVLTQNQHISGNVLLVDDVMTSGNTLSVCSRLLRNAGAENVYCATVATSVKNVHLEK